MRRIIAQARKELTQIFRDRLALLLALVLPVILLWLLGSTVSLTAHDLPIIVQDLDASSASRAYIDAFRESITFHVVAWPPDRQPEEALIANQARGALILPRRFGRDLARGVPADVQLLVDATDANTARLVQGYAVQVTRAFNERTSGAARVAPVRAEIRLWYNPGRDAKKFYGPGMFVLGESMFPPLLSALVMAK